MSKPTHTPGPWRIHQTQDMYSIFENRCLVASMSKAFTEQTTYANAKRIVDCVNAMEGIENPSEFISNLRKCLYIEDTPELLEKTVREEAESL